MVIPATPTASRSRPVARRRRATGSARPPQIFVCPRGAGAWRSQWWCTAVPPCTRGLNTGARRGPRRASRLAPGNRGRRARAASLAAGRNTRRHPENPPLPAPPPSAETSPTPRATTTCLRAHHPRHRSSSPRPATSPPPLVTALFFPCPHNRLGSATSPPALRLRLQLEDLGPRRAPADGTDFV
ncbi:hypothetical protein GQ55_2G414000 [Panicum hallii var. hallii]|uniref:Uncharacterized protein n=1 Tax=Panicum hallii var. hallii TaxID=1504633 RepID=A0A2T7EXX9_9POAL|nr:hypothetical protein GQ55_2G414000 [Panicum hallii var. hallii]